MAMRSHCANLQEKLVSEGCEFIKECGEWVCMLGDMVVCSHFLLSQCILDANELLLESK